MCLNGIKAQGKKKHQTEQDLACRKSNYKKTSIFYYLIFSIIKHFYPTEMFINYYDTHALKSQI